MAAILNFARQGTTGMALRVLLCATLFALPWIDRTNLSTLLLCGLGIVAVLAAVRKGARSRFRYDPLFIMFGLYYLGFIIAWAVYPQDRSATYALQQKAAFVAVPLLFLALPGWGPELWRAARAAFVCGTAFALLCCLGYAAAAYLKTGDPGLFFYHDLVKLLSANAIYTSLYVLISMVYLMDHLCNNKDSASGARVAMLILVVFLLGGLLLLSSKLLIVAGIISLLYYIFKYFRSKWVGIGLAVVLAAGIAAVLLTPNRINERFSVVAWQQPDVALRYSDYSNAAFDGLNLRLLLWRMGFELLDERKAWLTGLGGKHYHEALNEKIAAYKLYEGYRDIDFHSQYMEALVRFGIAGLILLIVTLGYILYCSFKSGKNLPGIITIIFSMSFLTESVLETQAGILAFTIIISGEWIQKHFS